MLPNILALAGFALLAPAARAASASDWQHRTIYQVMTDRFALPTDAGTPCDTSQQLYCGGTWAGITNHLSYIQSMGFSAIWISPIVGQLSVPLPPPIDGTSYHGYWPQDLTTLNPAFGTASDLKALSAALHARGMYLMLDVVVNHIASNNDTSAGVSFSQNVPFNSAEDFHPICPITNYDNQTNVEQCWLSVPGAVPLADLDTESQTVVDFYTQWIQQTVANYSIDGLRIDTLKHVRHDFWPGFTSASGVFTIGEVLDGDDEYVGNYTNYVDAVLGYPQWGMLTQAFETPAGSMPLLAQSIANTSTYYKSGGLSVGSFLENHDQPRFASYTSDQSLIKNAIAYTFVNDGIPILYQGQEQGYTGGPVPANREAIWLSGYATQKPLVQHVTTLNMARQAAVNASSSFISTPMKVLSTATHNIALSKGPILAVLTNTGTNTSSATWSVPATFGNNAKLVEVLSCSSATTDGSGNLAITFQQGAPQIYMPTSSIGTLCSSLAKSTSGALPGMSPLATLSGLGLVLLLPFLMLV